MPKYENSIIYKIKHNEDYDDKTIYIGSTSNFKNRKNRHKFSCINEKDKDFNLTVYQFIRDNDGWDNWVMTPIEQYPCNDKKELEIRERYHIDLLRPTLNRKIPTRTKKQYYEDNKDKILEKTKEYNENNKEKKMEYYKIYLENNKEQLAEKRKEKGKVKVICDHCGCEVRNDCLKRHQKSNKCINFVKTE